jgi:hypothetical protein
MITTGKKQEEGLEIKERRVVGGKEEENIYCIHFILIKLLARKRISQEVKFIMLFCSK